jgi:uncharacterized damage-inducible protein DinB
MADVLDALIEENAAARAELMQAVDALPADQRLQPAFGDWSVKDVMAHLAGWQEGMAEYLEQAGRGERPRIPDFEDGDIDRYNHSRVAESADASWELVMGRLRAARERQEAAIRGLRALEPERYAEGRSAHRLASVAEHDREHVQEILAWRGELTA